MKFLDMHTRVGIWIRSWSSDIHEFLLQDAVDGLGDSAGDYFPGNLHYLADTPVVPGALFKL